MNAINIIHSEKILYCINPYPYPYFNAGNRRLCSLSICRPYTATVLANLWHDFWREKSLLAKYLECNNCNILNHSWVHFKAWSIPWALSMDIRTPRIFRETYFHCSVLYDNAYYLSYLGHERRIFLNIQNYLTLDSKYQHKL